MLSVAAGACGGQGAGGPSVREQLAHFAEQAHRFEFRGYDLYYNGPGTHGVADVAQVGRLACALAGEHTPLRISPRRSVARWQEVPLMRLWPS